MTNPNMLISSSLVDHITILFTPLHHVANLIFHLFPPKLILLGSLQQMQPTQMTSLVVSVSFVIGSMIAIRFDVKPVWPLLGIAFAGTQVLLWCT